MLKNSLFLLLLATSACSNSAAVQVTPSPTVALPEIPTHPACSRKYVSIKMDTFQNCLVDGMHYIQVANILGNAGKLQSQSGDFEIWGWADGDGGFLSVSFRGQKMVGKSQVGLASS